MLLEEVIKQIISVVSVVLIVVTSRISYDLILTLIKSKTDGSFSLLAIFISMTLVGVGAIVTNYVIDLPIYLLVSQALVVTLACLGSYGLLRDLHK